MQNTIRQYFTRPPRQTYYTFDLGPNLTFINKQKCIRQDFWLLNIRNYKLSVSYYHLEASSSENCLIYLHTHNGSKLEAVSIVDDIIETGVNLCLFDFQGYGNSQGQTVSLGIKEVDDIRTVIDCLQDKYNQNNFLLWGRSMGAVAALLFLENLNKKKIKTTYNIIGSIFDSPFQSLEKLTCELGSKQSHIPELLLKPLLFYIKNTLQQQIDFNHLNLEGRLTKIDIPAVFIASYNDQFVHVSHCEQIYKQYGGKKQLIYIQRDHNQTRKKEDLEQIYQFIRKIVSKKSKGWENVVNNCLSYQRKTGRKLYNL